MIKFRDHWIVHQSIFPVGKRITRDMPKLSDFLSHVHDTSTNSFTCKSHQDNNIVICSNCGQVAPERYLVQAKLLCEE